MINWTQQGAGLRNAGITPQQLQTYYGNALTNYRAAQQPVPKIGGDVMTQRAQANSMTRLSNPFDLTSRVVANSSAPVAQQIAAHKNAVTASQPITLLSGWMERQGLGNSTQIANNIAKQGLEPVQQYLAPARDWEIRETVRGNVQGPRGLIGIGFKAAPFIMGAAAGGFVNPLSALTSVGKAAGGSLLRSVPNKLLANALTKFTTPTGLAQQAQAAMMRQMQRG